MYSITYEREFGYTSVTAEESFPILQFRMTSPRDSNRALDLDAYLDSGARRSLFDGQIATAIGLDLFTGPEVGYVSATGVEVSGRLHRVRLWHTLLGSFELEVGFSTSRIRRNLLGRDFFNLTQIGFRERYLRFYVTGAP